MNFFFKQRTSPEGKYISKLLKEEFESSGVHLPQIQQKQIGKLQEEIANLNRDYLLENDNPNDFDTFQGINFFYICIIHKQYTNFNDSPKKFIKKFLRKN